MADNGGGRRQEPLQQSYCACEVPFQVLSLLGESLWKLWFGG